MKNGRPRKAKGYKYETETVQEALDRGIPAKRFWGSRGRSGGYAEGVDTLVGFPESAWRIQNKRERRHPAWLRTLLAYLTDEGGCDAVVTREDQGESYVILPYSKFLTMIEEARNGQVTGLTHHGEKPATV